MGRSTTPRYVFDIRTDDRVYNSTMEWRVRSQYNGQLPGYGPPTQSNAQKWVTDFEKSCEADGPNKHLGPTKVLYLVIRDQLASQVVLEWYPKGTQ